MGNTLYDKIQNWWNLAKQSAMDALYEEIELAKSIGSVDSKGNALIAVICDGGWGKRSYGKALNSLSGYAVLIGVRTKKVIFFSVRNKYCHTCKIAESKFTPPNFHICNKTYTCPSSGMEADIILEGFKSCEQHGARFNKLIADRDSSTYKAIRVLRIYRNPDLFVEKCECVNHLFRNFRTRFNFLTKVTKFKVASRKHITKSKGKNAAEEFNNIVAKYLGGKRINYSLGPSYTARVAEYRKFIFGSNHQTAATTAAKRLVQFS